MENAQFETVFSNAFWTIAFVFRCEYNQRDWAQVLKLISPSPYTKM